MATPPTYIAVIGDIVDSRGRDDRAALQARLLDACRELNERSSFIAPLRLTSGDEFEVLVTPPWAFGPLLVAMEAAAWPSLVTFGIGRGELATDLPHEAPVDVGALDGPAFHRARGALEAATTRQAWFGVAGFSSTHQALLNAIGDLLGLTRRRWTERQREIVLAAATHAGTRKALAGTFDISPSVVTETLNAAEFDTFQRALDELDAGWPASDNSVKSPNTNQDSAK